MVKKTRNMLLLISSLLLGVSVGALAACEGEKVSTEQPEELKYHYNYEISSLAIPDAFMTMDGKLEETEWQGQIPHVNVVENMTISTKTIFTDKGLYVGVEVTDNGIYYAADFNMDKNSSVKITVSPVDMITPIRANDEITVDIDTKNLRSYCVIKYAFASSVQGGAVNSGDSTGMTTEFFLPWGEMPLPEKGVKPDRVRVAASYNKVTGADLYATNRWVNPGYQQRKPSLCYVFDENGYTQQDSDAESIGNSYSGLSKTGGWDLSDAANGVYHTIGNNNQWLFFKNISAENYIVQATVKIVGGIDDPGPHAGIMIGRNETQKNALLVDGRVAYLSGNRTQLRVLTQAGTSWSLGPILYHDTNFPLKDKLQLKVIKNGSLIYYIVNDTYICSDELLGMEGKTEPGLYTVGCEAYFSNLSCTVYDTAKNEEKESLVAEIARYTNTVTVPENLRGGVIESNCRDVVDGGDVQISLQLMAGYKLDTFEINGEDKLDELRNKIDGNVYTLKNVTEAVEINATFVKLNGVKIRTVKGAVETSDGLFEDKAKVLVIDKNDSLGIYTTAAKAYSGYNLRLPEGEYEISISLDGYQTKTEEFTLSGGTLERETMLLTSAKGLPVNAMVTLNNGEICSGTINYGYYSDGSVVGDTAGHGYTYLKDAHGERMVVEANISLVSNPSDMNPSAGFTFSTKSDADIYGFTILCIQDGLRIGNIDKLKNGDPTWGKNILKLRSTTFRDTKQSGSIHLAVVRDGGLYYVFLDRDFVDTYTIDYTVGETATGFYTAGCSARFSDYNWSKDDDVIDEWIALAARDPYNEATFIQGAVVGYNDSFVVETTLFCKELQGGNVLSMAGFSFTSSNEINGNDGFSIGIYQNKIFVGRLYTNSYEHAPSLSFTAYANTSEENALTLKVVKYLGNYFVFVNGHFVYVSQNDAFIKTSGADIRIALQSWGSKAGFKNITYTVGETAAKAMLTGILATEKAIDGDLSDWNETNWTGEQAIAVRQSQISATNAAGDGFKAMSYLGTDGVYLAIEIKHTTLYNVYPGNDDKWYNYSYVAFFLNGTTSATMKSNGTQIDALHQNRLLVGYTRGNVIAQIKTVGNNAEGYTTTIEVFVPWSACDNYSEYLKGDPLRMGFDCNMGMGMMRPHGAPDVIASQYYLTPNGLTLSGPSDKI